MENGYYLRDFKSPDPSEIKFISSQQLLEKIEDLKRKSELLKHDCDKENIKKDDPNYQLKN